MKKISRLSNDSNAFKAPCAEGAKNITKTPIPYWMCGVDFMDLHAEKKLKELDLNKKQSGFITPMIKKIMRAVKSVFAFLRCNIFRADCP